MTRRLPYVAKNLILNLAAPMVLPLIRSRGSLGIDDDPAALESALARLRPGLDLLGGVAGRDVLELGPGRSAGVLQRLIDEGARSATGVDLQLAIRNAGAARFIQYDGRNLPLPDAAIDVVVSKSVLEHVHPRDVDPLIADIFRVLRPGGGAVHIIDLRDHMFIDGDELVTGDWLDALRYPEWLFRAMFRNRSTTINRLREPEWRELFTRHGFSMLEWVPSRLPLPSEFERTRLNSRFRSVPDDLLAVAYLTVVLRRPPGGRT